MSKTKFSAWLLSTLLKTKPYCCYQLVLDYFYRFFLSQVQMLAPVFSRNSVVVCMGCNKNISTVVKYERNQASLISLHGRVTTTVSDPSWNSSKAILLLNIYTIQMNVLCTYSYPLLNCSTDVYMTKWQYIKIGMILEFKYETFDKLSVFSVFNSIFSIIEYFFHDFNSCYTLVSKY